MWGERKTRALDEENSIFVQKYEKGLYSLKEEESESENMKWTGKLEQYGSGEEALAQESGDLGSNCVFATTQLCSLG